MKNYASVLSAVGIDRGVQTKKERPAPKTRTLFIRSKSSRANNLVGHARNSETLATAAFPKTAETIPEHMAVPDPIRIVMIP